MKKHTIRNIATGTVMGAGIVAAPVEAVAQYSQDNFNDFRKIEVLKAYRTLDSIATFSNSRNLNSPLSREERINIEHFLGAENGLYNLSTASIQTFPKSGENSIVYFGNEAWLRVMQVGSAYGKANYGEFKAEARVSRDLSTTPATIANLLGLSDEEINQMIFLSNGITAEEQNIIRDRRTQNVIDVLYIGTQKRDDVVDPHLTMNGANTGKHILAVPGNKLYLPMTPVMEKLGYQKTFFFIPGNAPEAPNNKPDMEKNDEEDNECPTCPRKPNPDRDSIEYRIGLMGMGSNTHVAGIAAYSQLGKCAPWNRWDGEIGFSFLRLAGEFNKMTKEANGANELNYPGISQLLEKGAYDIKNYRMHIIMSRHVGKTQYFFLRGGISADIANEKYNGSEKRETWFEAPHAVKLDYDMHTNGVISNKTNIRVSPVLGMGVDLGGRLRITVDGHIPIMAKYNSPHAGIVDAGTVEFGLGLNFGNSKHDHRYSNQAINKQNQKYNNSKSYNSTAVRK